MNGKGCQMFKCFGICAVPPGLYAVLQCFPPLAQWATIVLPIRGMVYDIEERFIAFTIQIICTGEENLIIRNPLFDIRNSRYIICPFEVYVLPYFIFY